MVLKDDLELLDGTVVPIEIGKSVREREITSEFDEDNNEDTEELDALFAKVMSDNRAKRERMRKERAEANRSVMRSYRIRKNGRSKL